MANGELFLDHYLAMSPGTDDDAIDGIDTIEPSFGLPAKWITEDMKEEAEIFGYTVVDPPSVVSTHITEIIKTNAYDLLGRQETKQLIDHLKEQLSNPCRRSNPKSTINRGSTESFGKTIERKCIYS